MKVKRITVYAIIAALYTVISLILGSFSFGAIQLRISEVLMILCIFSSDFILPLTLGCFLTNLLGLILGLNFLTLDLIFGTIATLISAYLMYKFKNITFKNRPLLSLLTPCIINGLIIGIELALYYNYQNTFLNYFLYSFIWIFLGEFVSVFIMGLMLYKPFSNLSAYLNSLE